MRFTELHKAKEVNVWRVIGLMITIGIVMVFSYSAGLSVNTKYFLFVSSVGLLTGGAFFTAGGLAGFLFGIPKLVQNNLVNEEKPTKTVIVHNDNLVQISDWLTKIIVGVGLTQLNNIPKFVLKVGDKLSPAFGGGPDGKTAAIVTISYFIVIGFLSVYMWTRLYFVKLLKVLDDELDFDALKKQISENKEEQERKLDLSILDSKIDQFEKLKSTMINAETNFDNLKELFKNFNPGAIKIINDTQKGRWGGLSSVNGIRVEASFRESLESNADNKKIFTITLVVRGSAENYLSGNVYFFLHESYLPNHVMMVEAENNEASITIESYEAFTVGILCQNGTTALELDLNEDINAPKEYKYREHLMSIDDLYEQKALLLT